MADYEKKVSENFVEDVLSQGVRDMPQNPASQGYSERQIRAFYYKPEELIAKKLQEVEGSIKESLDDLNSGKINTRPSAASGNLPVFDNSGNLTDSGVSPDDVFNNYNELINKPIIPQDLDDANFTPVTNTYYMHNGASLANYIIGGIYFYNGEEYNFIGGGGGTDDYNELLNKPIIPKNLNDFTPTANTYYIHTGTTSTNFVNGGIYFYDGSSYGLCGDHPLRIIKGGTMLSPVSLLNFFTTRSQTGVYLAQGWFNNTPPYVGSGGTFFVEFENALKVDAYYTLTVTYENSTYILKGTAVGDDITWESTWAEYVSITPAEKTAFENKVKTNSLTIDTPVWTNQPTIEGTLDSSFLTYTAQYYFVTLKDTDGNALPSGQFKLSLTQDGFATAISQIFTLTDYDTGNSGILAENSIVDFKTISNDRTSFEMRDDVITTSNLQYFNLLADESIVASGKVKIQKTAIYPYTQTVGQARGQLYVASNSSQGCISLIEGYYRPAFGGADLYTGVSSQNKFSATNRFCYLFETVEVNVNKGIWAINSNSSLVYTPSNFDPYVSGGAFITQYNKQGYVVSKNLDGEFPIARYCLSQFGSMYRNGTSVYIEVEENA